MNKIASIYAKNSMKLQQIIEFSVGFFGPVIIVFAYFARVGLNDDTRLALFVLGSVFLLYFMFLLGKSTEKLPGFISRAKLKTDTYFTKGLILFSIAVFVFSFVAALCCSIIPGLL